MNIKGINLNKSESPKIMLGSSTTDKCDFALHDAIIHEKNKIMEKNKLMIHSGTIDKLKSFNDKDIPAYFKISNKTKAFECGIRDVDSSRNRYTMHIPYIRNKEMDMRVRDGVIIGSNGGAYSDRGSNSNNWHSNDFYQSPRPMTKESNNHRYHGNSTPRNSTLSILPRYTLSPKLILNNEVLINSLNNSFLQDDRKNINILNAINKEYNNQRKHNKPRIKYIHSIDSQPFYRELGKQKNESINHFLSPLKHNSINICIKNNRKPKQVFHLQKTNFLNMQYKDKIPLQYPFAVSNQNGKIFKGKNNRYLMLMNELHRVKYIISIEKKKEHAILKEFFIKNGIYNKLDIQEKHFESFSNFLQGKMQLNHEAMSKSFKDIIIDILEDNISNDTISKRSNRSSNGKDIKDDEIGEREKKTIKNKELNERYSKVPLSKQNQQSKADKSSSKQLNDLVKELESELGQIIKEKPPKAKPLYPGNQLKSSQAQKVKGVLYLTQSPKSIDCHIGAIKRDDLDIILSNKKLMTNKCLNEVLVEDNVPKQLVKSNSWSKIESSTQEVNLKKIKSQMKLTEFIYLLKARQRMTINSIIQNLNIEEIMKEK